MEHTHTRARGPAPRLAVVASAVGGWSLEPFAGVNNLFDEDYNANVRINAFAARYFEAAPTRNAYAGMRVGYSFR